MTLVAVAIVICGHKVIGACLGITLKPTGGYPAVKEAVKLIKEVFQDSLAHRLLWRQQTSMGHRYVPLFSAFCRWFCNERNYNKGLLSQRYDNKLCKFYGPYRKGEMETLNFSLFISQSLIKIYFSLYFWNISKYDHLTEICFLTQTHTINFQAIMQDICRFFYFTQQINAR